MGGSKRLWCGKCADPADDEKSGTARRFYTDRPRGKTSGATKRKGKEKAGGS